MEDLAKAKMMESRVLVMHTLVADDLIILKAAEQLA